MRSELGDAPGVRGHARQADEHRLHQRLRHALVGVRRQRKDVERLQPGHDVALVAREPDARAQVVLVDQRFERLALRPVADDDEADAFG